MDVTNQFDGFNVQPRIVCLWFLHALAASACTSIHRSLSPGPSLEAAPPAVHIEPAALLSHIEILASDAFEGRKPGTNGEVLTVDYLVNLARDFLLLVCGSHTMRQPSSVTGSDWD